MLCPIDNTELVITDRNGIEIDYCPKCRGVWLDRGELDKIIERASAYVAPRDDARQRDDHYEDREYREKGKKRKKGSFLEDMFDFF